MTGRYRNKERERERARERERDTETDSHVNRSIDRQKQNERGVEKARDWNRISCRDFCVEVSILVGGLGSIHVTVNPKDSNLSAANPEPQPQNAEV